MKTTIKMIMALLIAALALSACDETGGSGAKSTGVKSPAVVDPNAPSTPDVTVTPTPTPGISVTYYTKTEALAPVTGWQFHTVTLTGSCVVYNGYTFCWDNGPMQLPSWVFNSASFGGGYYSYWALKSNLSECIGACTTDAMAAPTVLSNHLITLLNNAANDTGNTVTSVMNTGVAKTVSCTVSGNLLNCTDFAIDLNQTPL